MYRKQSALTSFNCSLMYTLSYRKQANTLRKNKKLLEKFFGGGAYTDILPVRRYLRPGYSNSSSSSLPINRKHHYSDSRRRLDCYAACCTTERATCFAYNMTRHYGDVLMTSSSLKQHVLKTHPTSTGWVGLNVFKHLQTHACIEKEVVFNST